MGRSFLAWQRELLLPIDHSPSEHPLAEVGHWSVKVYKGKAAVAPNMVQLGLSVVDSW